MSVEVETPAAHREGGRYNWKSSNLGNHHGCPGKKLWHVGGVSLPVTGRCGYGRPPGAFCVCVMEDYNFLLGKFIGDKLRQFLPDW